MEIMKEKHEVEKDQKQYNYRGIKAMPFIMGNETFERLGTIGTLANLVVYLTTVFNMKSVTATTLINIFNGATNSAPLFGALLSDIYLGRFKTLAFASVCSFVGLTMLALTAAIPRLHPPKCAATDIHSCIGATPSQLTFLFGGFGFLVIGAAGIRSCNLAFGADQFNPNTESGKKGITSFFNWYFFSFTFAVMISVTVIVYVQSSVSWAIGLAIPSFLMFISCALFFWGSNIFVKVLPEGNPVKSVAQVMVAAAKKHKLKLPDNPAFSLFNYIPSNSINSNLPYTDQFRFLDKAAIITSEDQLNTNGSAANPWRLCTMQQVEETKCVLRVIPIWASAIIYFISILQQYTYAILQALQSDRRLGTRGFKVPAATFIIFYMLALTIWIPIYDRIIVPYLRKITHKEGGITVLQRMGIGIVLSALTMIVSGLIEEKRRYMALTLPTLGVAPKGGAISSMSAFWLIPQLALAGITEAFNSVGQFEFYYKQFPENMRSIANSSLFLALAGSSFVSGLLISVVHHVTRSQGRDWLAEDLNVARLDCFYYMIAGLGILNFGYFLVVSKWYRYKGTTVQHPIYTQKENTSLIII